MKKAFNILAPFLVVLAAYWIGHGPIAATQGVDVVAVVVVLAEIGFRFFVGVLALLFLVPVAVAIWGAYHEMHR